MHALHAARLHPLYIPGMMNAARDDEATPGRTTKQPATRSNCMTACNDSCATSKYLPVPANEFHAEDRSPHLVRIRRIIGDGVDDT